MMTDYSSEQERLRLTLRACSNMDSLMVERLRDTVQISVNWADEILDILIQMDHDVHGLEAALQYYANKVQTTESAQPREIENMSEQYEAMNSAASCRLESVRAGIRDTMTSMQNQDVIGQAIERAAAILDKRAEAMAKAADDSNHGKLHSAEIADLHRKYLEEDDLHRAPDSMFADRKAA
jgi:hypothetical protein